VVELLRLVLPYLGLFYLLDSVKVLWKSHLLFYSHAGALFKVRGSGISLAGLSPLGQSVLSHCQPVCFTESGVYLYERDCLGQGHVRDGEPAFIPYEEIEAVEAEHTRVRINGNAFYRAPSRLSALHIAGTIKRLKEAPARERLKRLASMPPREFNLNRLQALRQSAEWRFLPVQVFSSVLFACVFCLLPLALYTGLGRFLRIDVLVLGLSMAYVLTVVSSYIAHVKLYRGEQRRGLVSLLLMVLSPVTVVHAVRGLSADAYMRFDYLTISAALLPESEFKKMAFSEMRRILHVFMRAGREDLRRYWSLREQAIQGLLRARGISVHELELKPVKGHADASAYCPCCLAEYRGGFGECSDCGVELRPF
jgi:hypothetical protein